MNPRTLTITAAEWASVRDGSLWLVQEADVGQGGLLYPPVEFVEACAPCETCGDERAVFCPDCGERGPRECVGDGKPHVDCPDCRIELVRPCPDPLHDPTRPDGGWGICAPGACDNGTITLGYAYAVGQPLPIIRGWSRPDGNSSGDVLSVWKGHYGPDLVMQRAWNATAIQTQYADRTAALAHYGPPESLVGKWAMELRRVS